LISTAACLCIDVIPIPGKKNEVGFFEEAFANVVMRMGSIRCTEHVWRWEGRARI
jgi:hypothetical protein